MKISYVIVESSVYLLVGVFELVEYFQSGMPAFVESRSQFCRSSSMPCILWRGPDAQHDVYVSLARAVLNFRAPRSCSKKSWICPSP